MVHQSYSAIFVWGGAIVLLARSLLHHFARPGENDVIFIENFEIPERQEKFLRRQIKKLSIKIT